MDRLIALLASESCTNLLLALAHTLWQSALVAGVLFLYLRRTRAVAANRRYVASVAALGAIVLGALLTWSILSYKPAEAPPDSGLVSAARIRDTTSTPATSSPQASSSKDSASQPVPPLQASGSRQVWIMEAWLAGVALMFLRLAALVVGGNRLRRRCRVTEDSQMLDLIEQLRTKMGIGRSIRVLVGDSISTPGVVGCFWPTLLLPASMVSGIPAEDLQAILTHELAHIRRYDYLVNFLQMVVEALLFFNPAVWWISRQARIEREACCDAAGVLWTGQRTRYAEVLVAWAQRFDASQSGTPAPAVGFGRDVGGGNLLDRVRRILIADHQPRPRVPWHIATAMVVLSLACLVIIQQATDLAVNLAGRILTPQERIDKIAAISGEYGVRHYTGEESIHISGTARTWDGKPLTGKVSAFVRSSRRDSYVSAGIHATIDSANPDHARFSNSVAYGQLSLTVAAEGYAPAFAGPLEAKPGGSIKGIELVLTAGFSGRIQITDEVGQPVQGAELVGGYDHHGSGSYAQTIHRTTDANGVATLDHAAAAKVALRVYADGFESKEAENLVLDPNQTQTIMLKKGQPVGGMVVAQATGRPIAGAHIHILESAQAHHYTQMGTVEGAPDAVTDAEGRFTLSRLRRDWKYLLFVRAPGYGYRYVPEVTIADHSLHVALGEKKTIRGKVIGDLSLLATGPDSIPTIGVRSSFQYPSFSFHTGYPTKSPVTIRDGVGYFETDNFWGQIVTLLAGVHQVRLDIERDRLDNVVLDLRPAAQRQVVLRFQTPQGAPPIEGSVRIDYSTERPVRHGESIVSDAREIAGNQTQCTVPVPSQLRYDMGTLRGKRPMGYWFEGSHWIDIAPGDDPLVIEIPVYSAGAIYGKILRPDGGMAERANASLVIAKKPDIGDEQSHILSDLPNVMNNRVDRGTFNMTPLPLGGKYAVVVHEDYAFAMSDTFSLDEKTPIIQVDLKLPQGVDVVGRLLDVDGTPARNQVALHISVQQGEHPWGLSGGQIQPDETGGFVFKNVNPGSRGECSVRVIGGAGYRPLTHKIRNLRSPVVLQLERGLCVAGTVIDNTTGWPVSGAEVYASRIVTSEEQFRNDWEFLDADRPTDEQGRFAFTNMARKQYQLGIRSANLVDSGQPFVVTGGQSAQVVLRIRIPEGSNLQPREP